MKRILSSLLMLVLLLSLVAVFLPSCGGSDVIVLNVYNWGEYISDGSDDSLDVNQAFEEYCKEVLGIKVKVNYVTYTSNEDMYAKLSAGAVSYDVIVPSDYMIARLADEKLLQELNFDNIPNYDECISDDFKGLYYDPENKYSVPYTYGMIGVIYDANRVDAEDVGDWDLMWNDKYSGSILQFNTIIMAKGINIFDVLVRLKPFGDVMQARYLQIVFADEIKLCTVLAHDIVELLSQSYTTKHQNNVTNI